MDLDSGVLYLSSENHLFILNRKNMQTLQLLSLVIVMRKKVRPTWLHIFCINFWHARYA
jgi:hypothetical protein